MSGSSAGGLAAYRCLSWLVSPLVFAHLLWRSFHDGGWPYLKQRLGFAQPDTRNQSLVWLHAASVGEINTAMPLLQAILVKWPDTCLLVSTNTPTGKAALDRQSFPATHCYLPLDYRHAVKRFYRSHNIRCSIIMETEVWPMLYDLATMPLVIANGRLSQRTLRVTEGRFKNTFIQTASKVHTVLARSESDAAGFARMGVPNERIKHLGNLKFAIAPKAANPEIPEQPLVRSYCLLASTHANEELELAKHWLQQSRDELLVIAPRHPDRAVAIEKQLATLETSVSVRSRNEAVTGSTRIYLADTLGEMPFWFSFANAIFMGGSLVEHGGHNMLEPAQLGKSVVTGPHTHNFKQEVDLLENASAIWRVANAQEAIGALGEWMDKPELCRKSGQRALAVIEQHRHIEQDYLAALTPFVRAAACR